MQGETWDRVEAGGGDMWVPALGHPVGGASRDQAPLLQPRDA